MKLYFKIIVFCSLIPILIYSCKSSQEKQEDIIYRIPDPKTLNETYVSDPDNILQPSTISLLNSRLRDLDMSEKAHIDVVLVNSIGNQVPKDIAYKLFNTWKIGREDTNNGLLIFLVLDQRRVEFETGLGLEPVLTDMVCGSIQRTYMIPYLKQENYDQAILSAIPPIIQTLDTGNYSFNDEDASINEFPSEYDSNNSMESDNHSSYKQKEALFTLPKGHSYSFIDFISNNSSFLSKFIPVLLVIIIIFNSTKNNKSCLGCLFSLLGVILTLFTSFITIVYAISAKYNLRELIYLFLIIYFIIGILLQLKYSKIIYSITNPDRYKNYYYLDKYKRGLKIYVWFFPFIYWLYRKHCNDMKKYRYEPYTCEKCNNLMVLEKEKNLSEGQMKEEELKSVEYDIWLCEFCNSEKIIQYPNKHSKIKKCKKCHFTTSVFKKNVVVKNATTSSSGQGYNLYVCEFCHAEDKETYTIPKESDSSSESYGGSSGSSSSSSSSSSGGCSGGGGAGSSW